MTRSRRSALPALALCFTVLSLTACSGAVRWLGVALLYEEEAFPEERMILDLPYRTDSERDDAKHRLDLYRPGGSGWPTVVFVHGGGWTRGDRQERIGGEDIYGNIGRFLAARGYGAAVISYRLQFEFTWREQVSDVAHAVAWVHREIGGYGGDPEGIFLMGHSAGAQLSTYVALDDSLLAELGVPRQSICGAIPVSGGGYDLADEETYRLGARLDYYEKRFRAGAPADAWQREASAITYLDAGDPPFLMTYGTREWESLAHQNRLLHDALAELGIDSRLVPIEGQSHGRMVLSLSRPDRQAPQEVLAFLERTPCPRG